MDFAANLTIDAPPILPDVERQLRGYLLCINDLPIHNYEKSQQNWTEDLNPYNLFFAEPSDSDTTLNVGRDFLSGKLKDFKEISVDGAEFSESENCNIESVDDIIRALETVEDVLGNEEVLTLPPWLTRGCDLGGDKKLILNNYDENGSSNIVNLINYTQPDQDMFELSKIPQMPCETNLMTQSDDKNLIKEVKDSEVFTKISKEISANAPVLILSEVKPLKGPTSTQWAEVVDISQPVNDFHERVPDMAFKYNFELDTFQKQAILKLEEHCSVLVAAHTSAGKTAIAEYAIALSQRHMTRTIYTSPIKALSNQKYRDFRNTFKDVGLITGDFQINQKGTCLVMTTEILKSMLLAQNEILRDLEYVVFDEVHYINDSDRGHIWEEVVILLPQHVGIVMLSATVPNTLQFADWVGRTKQQKMYVISTTQRPVPLEHFLYTGSGGNSRNERFLILSANNEFQRKGYLEAIEAKKKRESKYKKGPKDKVIIGRKQETTMWVALVEHLLQCDKLPVVAFILSRKRCDEIAQSLTSLDLTSCKEKSHVRQFFQKSIQILKEPDRNLPQILRMKSLLENGIGIHHSGILPILKEIVEMLFQERCVKILFATETFAMGVNMPAKTVVFDKITKHDGSEFRLLLPSEYIQMAGRAGRRGLDKTGTVIIICKGDVPSEVELMQLMKGTPRKIESQFRLTYSIILKLERKRIAAEGRVTVEEMMANSFKEADHLKMKRLYAENLSQVEKDLSGLDENIDKSETWEQLSDIFESGLIYLEIWKELSTKVLFDKLGLKIVVPGRVVLVTHKSHVNKLGIILSYDHKKETKFKVLVLNNKTEDSVEENKEKKIDEDWYKIISLLDSESIFVPEVVGVHTILVVDSFDILEVTTCLIKIDPKIILSDWETRLLPRFRGIKPGNSFQKALEELTELTHNSVNSDPKLEYINLLEGMKITSDDDYKNVNELIRLKKKIMTFKKENILEYKEQLKQIFTRKYLEKKKENLKYLLSYQSMSLYADYKNRLEVLKMLNYVDNKYSVQMKGNVACEMTNYELLITELVLRNTLNDLQPAEIAALLSCFVYQGKKQEEPIQLTASLKAGIATIQKVAEEVSAAERECGVQSEIAGDEILNFDLVPVVYEWAREKPFSEIMKLTTIQEGIIVRCIQQLNETIRDVKDAARIIGEPNLQQKMDDASNAIKRDIVFAASLYMQ